MYTIRAHFQRFVDVLLPDLIGAKGVYVVWDSQARARPTYIGEGTVLKRLADHAARAGRRFAYPWDGYVALFSGSTRNVHKDEGCVVERLLLDVAGDTDRLPIVNSSPGSAAAVARLCRDEMLRVAISGFDPLIPPREARPLRTVKTISATWCDEGYECNHAWRLRRLRQGRW
jgi:hypothetical protein